MRSQLAVHVSGGVAEFPSDGSDWREILRKADEALYRAKQLGRNRICLPASSQMVTKTAHFTQTQLEKLADLARKTNKSEAYLLREALDDLLRKYDR
jgi:predicted signal transduction protein with EAL and GGDEF domain